MPFTGFSGAVSARSFSNAFLKIAFCPVDDV